MSVLSAIAQQNIEDELVKARLLTPQQLNVAKTEAEQKGAPLLSYLVSSGQLSDEDLTATQAKITKVPYVNLSNARVDGNVLKLLQQDIAERYMAVPVGEMQGRLVIAMLDADNVQAVDFLSNKIGRPIKVFTASEAGIKRVLNQYKSRLDTQMGANFATNLSNAMTADDEQLVQVTGRQQVKTIVQDSPISKALSAILEFAANNGASDVHIEPLETELKIRTRIDGILREVMTLPKNAEAAVISRVKILANLKIDEHRVPQDGQFTVKVGDNPIDLRIAISPTVWGEQAVIRLLDKSGTSLNLEDMGYTGRALRTIRKGIAQPNGMILTSGPTGSGKSTSLYALIQEIKDDAINIVTLEDPVEYKMPGINQIQVNSEVGLTFANGLRSILRQDPDVVMVGEIRDKETANLAVQAALTGHLVFSTLHTSSAAGILPRLLDMGVEPFLIASTVHTVIGQRLVRRVAAASTQSYQSSQVETEAIGETIGQFLPESAEQLPAYHADLGYKNLPLRSQNAYTLWKGQDSPDTPGGYKGRMGVYEVFEVTENVQELIMKKATSSQIQKVAQSQGMLTMRQDGYMKALNGQTTLDEVNRVAATGNA